MTRSSAGLLFLIIAMPMGLVLAASGVSGADDGITLHELVLFAHQLLFVYWLGPDIGVYYLGGRVTDPQLSVEQRLVAAQTMGKIDLVPRICMSLMLTVGGILTEFVGIPHPAWQWFGILLLGPVWLVFVLLVYSRQGTAAGETLNRLDWWFRWALFVGVLLSVGYSVSTGRLESAPWVAGKLVLFAAIILFGLLMRVQVKPLMAGIGRLAQEGDSAEVNQLMARSLARTKPFVIGLWICLLLEAWLGVVQPGSPVI